jgi:hypothetical protein
MLLDADLRGLEAIAFTDFLPDARERVGVAHCMQILSAAGRSCSMGMRGECFGIGLQPPLCWRSCA